MQRNLESRESRQKQAAQLKIKEMKPIQSRVGERFELAMSEWQKFIRSEDRCLWEGKGGRGGGEGNSKEISKLAENLDECPNIYI